ncbi:UNVERIFIED_CONTAM: hypothetical protein FKN15_070557 [Acipenser sinensis]
MPHLPWQIGHIATYVRDFKHAPFVDTSCDPDSPPGAHPPSLQLVRGPQPGVPGNVPAVPPLAGCAPVESPGRDLDRLGVGAIPPHDPSKCGAPGPRVTNRARRWSACTGPVVGQLVVPPPVPHGQPQEVWDIDAVSRDMSDAEPLFEEGTEPEAREASQQLAKMWPSKPFQPRRPQERQWRRAPPQQQAQSRGSMTAPSGVSARGQPAFARPKRGGRRPRGGGKPRPRGSGQAPRERAQPKRP